MSICIRRGIASSFIILSLAWIGLTELCESNIAFADPVNNTEGIDTQEADDDDDDFDPWRPGIVALHRDQQGRAVEQLDRRLLIDHAGGGHSVDPQGSVRWTGQLLTLVPGEYRLHFYICGTIRLSMNGQIQIEETSDRPRWLTTEPIEFDYGYHAIDLIYEPGDKEPVLKSHWEGPNFQLEPIPPSALFHKAGNTPRSTIERGHELVDALGCLACHAVDEGTRRREAPALTHLQGNIFESWLVRWISEPRHASGARDSNSEPGSTSRMPSFDVLPTDARAMATYLIANSASHSAANVPEQEADAAHGEQLFRTVGCQACHDIDFDSPRRLYDGSSLKNIASKRPASFFSRWLEQPSDLIPNHRMPIFPLSSEERTDLAAYLLTLEDTERKDDFPPLDLSDQAVQDRGSELLIANRCNACHELGHSSESEEAFLPVALPDVIDWDASCLTPANGNKKRPSYDLAPADAEAVREHITQQRQHLDLPSSGETILAQRNCLACHARDWQQGIAAKLPALIAAHPEFAPQLPTLTPPALTGVGDKLTSEALAQAISTKAPARRPWLAVRMPRFAMSDEELQALVCYFIATDRIPPRTVANDQRPDETALELAGRRLVTSDGFGCTSCHQVGSVVPKNVALNARGTNLSLLGKHIRRTWFDRWVRNPARIVPKMEMPSIQLAVHGVLDNDLNAQLEAVWHVLNQQGFEPPPPGALRIVRSTNTGDHTEDAHVLTDVMRVGDRHFIKPLLIGLPNRHSILFDLEKHHLTGWWIGDTAAQRTEGKTWYWEANGTPVLHASNGESEILIAKDGNVHEPQPQGQFLCEFDNFEHIGGGVRWKYRLRFESTTLSPTQLNVTQELTPIYLADDATGISGFQRSIQIDDIPVGASMRFKPLLGLDAAEIAIDDTRRVLHLASGKSNVDIQLVAPANSRFTADDDRTVHVVSTESDGSAMRITLRYLTDLPVDQFLAAPLPALAIEPVDLDIIPGYTSTELPLTNEMMPTGFAWKDDGTLIVSSLKGRVWLARDTDDDGLEDEILPYSDELAAPYGVANSGPSSIDCITKSALLRLWDDDGDGHADRTEVLASGWGHTVDYHDWVVGLPKDSQGRYYVALPCQQDDRSTAAARHRGTALRLVPRKPSSGNPRSYAIETICAGLRFPMGLALNRSDELFATDNQGNYNPFNELNWLVKGARYGFVNKLERDAGVSPLGRSSAIEIPHPWTRSVNGICFLDTPDAKHDEQGDTLFGPFEGHLLGCEYDTRRLIRMSLQRVGDVYQGAAYPFSRTPREGEPSLQGPLVCGVAPDGDVYVGNIRDSGWGGGTNIGSIVRLRPTADLPPGIAEVRATAKGFAIRFTTPIKKSPGTDVTNYHVESYRRKSTPAYGGDDMDRREERVDRATLSADGRQANVDLRELREGFVYAIHLSNLAEDFFPAEAYFTLRRIPPAE